MPDAFPPLQQNLGGKLSNLSAQSLRQHQAAAFKAKHGRQANANSEIETLDLTTRSYDVIGMQ